MGLYKFLKKFLALKKSMLSSNSFKNNFKVIKTVCKNNPKQFGRMKMFLLMTAVFDFSLAARIFILFCCENFCYYPEICFLVERSFLLLQELFCLLWVFFFPWENCSGVVRILFTLRQYFYYCENFFHVLRIFLLLWEFVFLFQVFSFCCENFSGILRNIVSLQKLFFVMIIVLVLWDLLLPKSEMFSKPCQNALVGYEACA